MMKEQANKLIQELVGYMLRDPLRYQWTAQGLGMLRVYLRPEVRLHIWSESLMAPKVSSIHTHPWDFESYVVCGHMIDRNYKEQPQFKGDPYMRQKILCGEGGGLTEAPEFLALQALTTKGYGPGDLYTHRAKDIHNSTFMDGTVTLVTRTFKDDTDHAFVYWPATDVWGSAEPRLATSEEINRVTSQALELLD